MLSNNELQFIKDTPLYRLATSTLNGRSHVVPMHTRMDGDDIVIGGHHFDISYKRKLIDRNQWIACVWDTKDEIEGIKGVEVRGKVKATGKIWDGSEYFILNPDKVFSWGIEEPAAESFRTKMNFGMAHHLSDSNS